MSTTQTRMRPSETLDSGIDSENRDPNGENVSSISDERGSSMFDMVQKKGKDAEMPSLSLEEALPKITDGSIPDPPIDPVLEELEENEQQMQEAPERDDVRSAEIPELLDDSVFIEGPNQESGAGISIPKAGTQDESMLGTSLHDELILAEVQPGSNSLLSRGWKKPKTSTCDLDDTRELGFETDVEDIDDEQRPSSRKTSTVPSEHVTTMVTTIPREVGLDAQDFRCPMCRKPIGAAFSKFGICGVDGLYYCSDCMQAGGEMPIPSRVLRSWDWKPRPVSDRGRAFIEANQDNVIIRIDQHNPTLYDHVPALKTMKALREKLQIASMYLFNCRESIADDFRRRVWPRDHLYNDIHAYSISDINQLHSGLLEKQIHGFLKHAIDHVMHCSLCRQKGFLCEICEAHDVIYPFQTESTYRCPHCFSVYHADCANRIDDCPKCVRRAKYEIRQEASDLPLG